MDVRAGVKLGSASKQMTIRNMRSRNIRSLGTSPRVHGLRRKGDPRPADAHAELRVSSADATTRKLGRSLGKFRYYQSISRNPGVGRAITRARVLDLPSGMPRIRSDNKEANQRRACSIERQLFATNVLEIRCNQKRPMPRFVERWNEASPKAVSFEVQPFIVMTDYIGRCSRSSISSRAGRPL